MRSLPVLLVALSLVSVAACGGNSPAAPSAPAAAPNAPTAVPTVATAADLAFCVTETNRYRTSIGRAALTQEH